MLNYSLYIILGCAISFGLCRGSYSDENENNLRFIPSFVPGPPGLLLLKIEHRVPHPYYSPRPRFFVPLRQAKKEQGDWSSEEFLLESGRRR